APITVDPRSTIRWCSIFLNKPSNGASMATHNRPPFSRKVGHKQPSIPIPTHHSQRLSHQPIGQWAMARHQLQANPAASDPIHRTHLLRRRWHRSQRAAMAWQVHLPRADADLTQGSKDRPFFTMSNADPDLNRGPAKSHGPPRPIWAEPNEPANLLQASNEPPDPEQSGSSTSMAKSSSAI
ncbi:hypothetical protein ACLOJK_036418, partial [Asimina triloba]